MMSLSSVVFLTAGIACGDPPAKDDGGTGTASEADSGQADSGQAGEDGGGTAGSDGADDAGGSAGDEAGDGSADDGSDGSAGDGTGDDGGHGDAGEGSSDDGSSDGDSSDGGSSDGGSSDGGSSDGSEGSDGGSGSSGSGSSGSGSGSSGSGSGSGSGSSGSGSGSGSGSSGSGSGATDTDGDGQLDSDELAAGTDPYDYYDRSYTGGYNVASCGSSLPTASTPSGSHNGSATTYAAGDVVANFQLIDHNGEAVDLYSFCDNHVMVVFSAMWCGSCGALAGSAQSKQSSYASLGFQYLEVLIEDRTSGSVSSSELNQWASSYSLSTVPVLDDSSKNELIYYEQNWGYPTIVHLEAGTMRVLSIDQGQTDPTGWL